MNINLGIYREDLQAHREVLLRANDGLVLAESPVLVPDRDYESTGAYQVWWPARFYLGENTGNDITDDYITTMVHITPDGEMLQMDDIHPDHWFDPGNI